MHDKITDIKALLDEAGIRGRAPDPTRLPGSRRMLVLALLCGAGYGVFMGLFSALRPDGPFWALPIALTAVKVPMLFLLTLLVTGPSLFVFSKLYGSKLGLTQTLRLLIGTIAITLTVLASLGPVTGFFTLSTANHPFMVLFNVAVFALSGIIGLAFLRKTLVGLFTPAAQQAASAQNSAPSQPSTSSSGGDPEAAATDPIDDPQPAPDSASDPIAPVAPRPKVVGAPPARPARPSTVARASVNRNRVDEPVAARTVFRIWFVIYALVGAQMSWILRPFIGEPGQDYVLFAGRSENFFIGVLNALGKLLG